MRGWIGRKIALGNSYILCAPLPVCRAWCLYLCVFPIYFSFVVEFCGDFVVYVFLPNVGMGDNTRDQQREWARKVVNLFRERGSAQE